MKRLLFLTAAGFTVVALAGARSVSPISPAHRTPRRPTRSP